jgi:aspartyl-tRNA(Asn)/glutamyl-tRNA(Gln) amidotransferase subunit A
VAETLASRALAEAVNLVSSRRIKDTELPAVEFRPQPREGSPIRLTPAKEPAIGAIGRAGAGLRAGELSCKELLEESLAAIERDNRRLNALAAVTEGAARVQSQSLDEELATGSYRGPLHGIPVSVKDVIDVAGVPTRAGSAAYNIVPEKDAASVELLKQAGVVVLGKAATHEFALGVTSPQSRNPQNASRVPGGSSGGSAIAVATGMGLASLGTDTRASIRVPAALCGVVGFKPTFGTVPDRGIVRVSWSMDHIAPIASSVADAALVVDVLTGSDGAQYAGADVSALRLGYPPDGTAGVDYGVLASFTSAMQLLGQLAGQVVEVDRPSTLDFNNANAAGLIVSRCEAAAYHRRLGLDRSKFSPEVRDQLDAADRVAAPDYLDAQRLRSVLAKTVLKVFEEVDVLVMPTSLVPAPPVEEADDYLLVLARNAVPWSFLGFPAISVPCGRTAEGLPVGLQLVAPPYEEATLVALGSAFESAR